MWPSLLPEARKISKTGGVELVVLQRDGLRAFSDTGNHSPRPR